MDWQEVIALAIVAVTAVLVVRHFIRKRRRSGCGSACGCDRKGGTGM